MTKIKTTKESYKGILISEYWKIYLKWAALVPLSFSMKGLAFILSPFLSLYSIFKNIDTLPSPFNYLTTHDADLNEWINVDDRYDGKTKEELTKLENWWGRTRWICRNPAYMFDAYILGFNDSDIDKVHEYFYYDNFKFKKSGARMLKIITLKNGKQYFTFRANFKLWKGYHAKCWIGWHDQVLDDDERMTHKLKFSPFKIEKSKNPDPIKI